MTCVGAIPFMMNFNIQFPASADLSNVRKVTKAVKTLEGIEALTLQHENGYEVACNVKMPHVAGAEEVLGVGKVAAEEQGLSISGHYCTGPGQEELLGKM